MNKVEVGEGTNITMVFDGDEKQVWPGRGNFLGIYFTVLGGFYEWVGVNGDWGECYTEQEAIRGIMEAWKR